MHTTLTLRAQGRALAAGLLMAGLTALQPAAFAQTQAHITLPTEAEATALIADSWSRYRRGVTTEQELVRLQITRAGQPVETKRLSRWTQFAEQGERVSIRFAEPAADRGQGLLILQERSAAAPSAAQMWLRMPSWPQARRITGDREGRYFGGTDLSFEDNRQLLGEHTPAFRYRVLQAEAGSWQVEAQPRDPMTSSYGRRLITLSRPSLAITEIQYFDRQGALIKTQRHESLQLDGTRWRAQVVSVDNVQERSRTVLTIEQRRLNEPLPERTFTPQFLAE
ncbi:outer membrane lipoprotein-sorting protein [Roseateles sp. DB2]|uniref:outer membrane lipoprotein-sorting protein n=1 Tax=Roseateles sp. DB2 TaxID=3453717 RepID=UPI003EEE524A